MAGGSIRNEDRSLDEFAFLVTMITK
jgi:hypothetical protein